MMHGKVNFDEFNTLYKLSKVEISQYTEDNKASIQSIVQGYPKVEDENKNSSLHALILYFEDFITLFSSNDITENIENIFNPLLWAMQGKLDCVNANGMTALRMLFLSNLSEYYKFKIALKFLDAGASFARGIECANSKQFCQRLFIANSGIIEDSLEYISFKFKILSHPAFIRLILKQSEYFSLKQSKQFLISIEGLLSPECKYTVEDAKKYVNNELAALNNFISNKSLPQETCDQWIEKLNSQSNSYGALFIICTFFGSNFIPYPVSCIIKKLKKAGANLDAKLSFISNSTALHIAVNCQNYKAVKALIDSNINLSIENEFGDTPLHLACLLGDLKIVNQLINAGASLNIQNKHQDTPLIIASCWGYSKIIESLINSGANINTRDIYQRSTLHCAINYNDTEIAKLLIEKGISINLVDKFGETALITASRLGCYHIASCLIKVEGIELNVCDFKMQYNALHWAVKCNQTLLVKLLLSVGIDIDALSKEGTALDIASEQNNSCIIHAIQNAIMQLILKQALQPDIIENYHP